MRMKHWWLCPIAVGLMLPLLLGCQAKDKQSAPRTKHVVLSDLTGDVFIVTRGRENMRMGLVTVSAVPESVMLAHIVQKDRLISQIQAEMGDSITTAEQDLERTQKAAVRAESTYAKVVRTAGADLMLGERKALDQASAALAQAPRRVEAAKRHLSTVRERYSYYGSSEFYFEGLPPGVSVAKTDADGKFTMRLPADQRFALAAKASRQILGTIEQYYWLIWVTCREGETTRVFLSNDNLLTVPSAESVVLAHER